MSLELSRAFQKEEEMQIANTQKQRLLQLSNIASSLSAHTHTLKSKKTKQQPQSRMQMDMLMRKVNFGEHATVEFSMINNKQREKSRNDGKVVTRTLKKAATLDFEEETKMLMSSLPHNKIAFNGGIHR